MLSPATSPHPSAAFLLLQSPLHGPAHARHYPFPPIGWRTGKPCNLGGLSLPTWLWRKCTVILIAFTVNGVYNSQLNCTSLIHFLPKSLYMTMNYCRYFSWSRGWRALPMTLLRSCAYLSYFSRHSISSTFWERHLLMSLPYYSTFSIYLSVFLFSLLRVSTTSPITTLFLLSCSFWLASEASSFSRMAHRSFNCS